MRYPILNILLVEDDPVLGARLKELLSSNGHRVKYCLDGYNGFDSYCNGHFNFCIFDVLLPDLDGFSLTERVRKKDFFIPIIVISSRDNKEDKRKAFDLGVDDFLVKPFEFEELLWRINAIKRRLSYNSCEQYSQEISLGLYSVDFTHQLLRCENNAQRLTRRECEVLRMLCNRKNQLVKRDEILMQLWGDVDYFHGRSLDVFISKLRRYLKNDPRLRIENIPTVGYILREETNMTK